MKKRLIALLLAVVMAFGFAVPALADAVLDSDFYVQNPNGSPAYLPYNKDAKGAGWSWSASARTMTLSGIDLRDASMCWSIAFENPPYDIKVVVKDGRRTNVRKSYSLEGKSLGVIGKGHSTKSLKLHKDHAIGVDARGVEFYHVMYKGKAAWVSSVYTYLK